MEHIFGPVRSRRLGFSLGVDLVPFKTCSLNCIYCQLGPTTHQTIERREYVTQDKVIRDLEEVLRQDITIDYITLSGSGEPTLNVQLGKIIAAIKEMTDIPVAVITNGTLLHLESVRDELSTADVVLPSLDAVSQALFNAVNKPHPELTAAQMISGLKNFRKVFKGKLWLEIMLVKGVNDSPHEVRTMNEVLSTIECDKIQLNTVVRPAADTSLTPLTREELNRFKVLLGERCEVIAEGVGEQKTSSTNIAEKIITVVGRRPLNLSEISDSLGIPQERATKMLQLLTQQGKIESLTYGSELYYQLKREVKR